VKAEDAKLPGAGISPKQCPRKWVAEKGQVPAHSGIGDKRRRAFSSQRGRSSLRYTRLHAISSVANNCRASLGHLRCLPSSRDVRPVGQHDSDRK